MRMIDADALIHRLLNTKIVAANLFQYANAVTNMIGDAPTIEAELVRHGRWKCNKPCPVCGGDRFEGLDADIWADWEPPYCPNCGAKMDGGED